MQNISRLFFSCSWNWPLAMAPGGCVQCMYYVHTLNMLCWCMSRGFLWAGVAAFPCHQQSHPQGEASLPLPAPRCCRCTRQKIRRLTSIENCPEQNFDTILMQYLIHYWYDIWYTVIRCLDLRELASMILKPTQRNCLTFYSLIWQTMTAGSPKRVHVRIRSKSLRGKHTSSF